MSVKYKEKSPRIHNPPREPVSLHTTLTVFTCALIVIIYYWNGTKWRDLLQNVKRTETALGVGGMAAHYNGPRNFSCDPSAYTLSGYFNTAQEALKY